MCGRLIIGVLIGIAFIYAGGTFVNWDFNWLGMIPAWSASDRAAMMVVTWIMVIYGMVAVVLFSPRYEK